MAKRIDMTGLRYGRLVVLSEAGRKNGHITWRVKCDCGNEIVVRGIDLRTGNTTSCDCYRKEVLAEKKRRTAERNRLKKLALALETK